MDSDAKGGSNFTEQFHKEKPIRGPFIYLQDEEMKGKERFRGNLPLLLVLHCLPFCPSSLACPGLLGVLEEREREEIHILFTFTFSKFMASIVSQGMVLFCSESEQEIHFQRDLSTCYDRRLNCYGRANLHRIKSVVFKKTLINVLSCICWSQRRDTQQIEREGDRQGRSQYNPFEWMQNVSLAFANYSVNLINPAFNLCCSPRPRQALCSDSRHCHFEWILKCCSPNRILIRTFDRETFYSLWALIAALNGCPDDLNDLID